jgi:hypothetical protein
MSKDVAVQRLYAKAADLHHAAHATQNNWGQNNWGQSKLTTNQNNWGQSKLTRKFLFLPCLFHNNSFF